MSQNERGYIFNIFSIQKRSSLQIVPHVFLTNEISKHNAFLVRLTYYQYGEELRTTLSSWVAQAGLAAFVCRKIDPSNHHLSRTTSTGPLER